jgi:hypothetical protein
MNFFSPSPRARLYILPASHMHSTSSPEPGSREHNDWDLHICSRLPRGWRRQQIHHESLRLLLPRLRRIHHGQARRRPAWVVEQSRERGRYEQGGRAARRNSNVPPWHLRSAAGLGSQLEHGLGLDNDSTASLFERVSSVQVIKRRRRYSTYSRWCGDVGSHSTRGLAACNCNKAAQKTSTPLHNGQRCRICSKLSVKVTTSFFFPCFSFSPDLQHYFFVL